MRVLLLGGTGDAKRLAEQLLQDAGASKSLELIYSVAGLVRMPTLPCEVISGGFTQFGGLASFLQQRGVELLIDCTHPYAQNISRAAVVAANEVGIKCWRVEREQWQPQQGDRWLSFADKDTLLEKLAGFQRVFFSNGQLTQAFALRLSARYSKQQQWLRTAAEVGFELPSSMTWIQGVGPFALDAERALLQENNIDVLVTKNSGGKATAAKLQAARELGITVLIQERPEQTECDRSFIDIEPLQRAVISLIEI